MPCVPLMCLMCHAVPVRPPLSTGKLNTNEENENRLGYDLYSGALADFLSEPALTVPISVGLYAKWGSGKSFLLGKLTGEKPGEFYLFLGSFFAE